MSVSDINQQVLSTNAFKKEKVCVLDLITVKYSSILYSADQLLV